MTTTSTNKGLDTDSKPSSRVLRPPGGGSSNIFGHYTGTDEDPQQRPGRHFNNAGKSESNEQVNKPVAQREAAGRSKQIAYNPITGEPIEPAPAKTAAKKETTEEEDTNDTEKKKEDTTGDTGKKSEVKATPGAQNGSAAIDHRSTRVSQPPGGKSSGPLW